MQNFESKMITFDLFPKAWKLSFLAQGPGVFDSCKLVNIYQHMVGLALSSATNDEKNKKTNMAMANKEIEAGVAEIEREEIMALVEEAETMAVADKVATVEEAEEATP